MVDKGFSFPLNGTPESCIPNVNDLFSRNLGDLLDFIIPLQGGREICLDGFKFLSDLTREYHLYSDINNVFKPESDPLSLYEPRIGYIKRLLESILSLVELEARGKAIQVDGFRLKNLEQWLTPGGGANDIIAHAASRCNLTCRFCYNKGAPPTLKPPLKNSQQEYREIQERIKYYTPTGGLNLFPNMGSPAECLAHPNILDILKGLRQKTNEAFRIPSNGSTLTLEIIGALAELKPLSVDVSLNSASLSRRKWLMGDLDPQIALDSLFHLEKAGIPYTIVIVPWPFPSIEIMLQDLRHTVLYVQKHKPILIQISLPGYAKQSPHGVAFSLNEVWPILKEACQELRSQVNIPIVLRPGLYEEYTSLDKLNAPTIIGVIQNSPAKQAGLKLGDLILKVKGLPVKNRWQARSLLTTLHQSELKKAIISVARCDRRLDFEINLSRYKYPYSPETATHLGIIFSSSGIPGKWFEELKEVIGRSGAKKVLLLTSTLVRPYAEKFLSSNGFLSGINLYVRVPPNDYFGGNIMMGDLMVVEDFIKAINDFINETKLRPDIVVIPSSPFQLSGWGRDLTGQVYLDIERRTGIPVTLAECNTIFD